MTERAPAAPPASLPNDLGKSIFPAFSVNVPMPSRTAVPARPPAADRPAPTPKAR
jgi:hypothetical protein